MIDFYRMRQLIRMIPEALMRVEAAEARAGASSANLSGMPRGSGGNGMENKMIQLARIREAYHETCAELEALQAEALPYINRLDADIRAVMRLRYLQGYSPDEIADCNLVPMSRSTVYRALRIGERTVQAAAEKENSTAPE